MSVDPNNVYVGLWTDVTRGRILGAVITLPSSAGAVFIALLAVFVHVAGIHLWHLVRFALHQFQATDKGLHPLARQVQAVLRNNGSAASTGLRLLELLWHWRGRSAPLGAASGLGVAGLAFAACIALAGVSSSTILDTTNVVVLLSSPHCGKFDKRGLDAEEIVLNSAKLVAYLSYEQEHTSLSSTYARQCYNGTSPPEACNGFAVPNITWSTDYHASCPFSEQMCIGAAMAEDTGRLNSNAVFGLNFPVDQQVDFRRLLTCVPIAQDGFVSTLPYTLTTGSNSSAAGLVVENRTANISYYSYGPAVDGSNFTILLDSYIAGELSGYYLRSMTDYGEDGGSFTAIPALNHSDGGLSLIFIQATSILYLTPVDDPVFGAHQLALESNVTTYRADRPAGVLGCLEQFQICKPGEDNTCSKLGLWTAARTEALATLNLNSIQKATVDVIDYAVKSIVNPADDTSDDMIAQRRLYTSKAQSSLPANQWQIEVENYQARTMASLQVRLTMQATGSSDASIRQHILPPTTDAETQLCRAQRVRVGQGFSNISLLGLVLVVPLGALIIVTSLLLDPIIGLIGRTARGKTARSLRSWNHDYVLQIQRSAYEGQTECKWDNVDGEVPIALDEEVLEPLRQKNRPISDANTGLPMEEKKRSVESSRLIG